MKKRLNTDAIGDELRQGSVFFRKEEPPRGPEVVEVIEENKLPGQPEVKQSGSGDTVIPGHHDTKQPLNHDTTIPQERDLIETIRGAVRQLGKEAATHRFTVEEKQALLSIVFDYKNRQIRTSENEIARIAINFLMIDYRKNGEKSVLARVLESLNK